ncbi:MAG: sugar ABC transporter permease [Anaerotignum sp.]|nr:sugar ABC transporter permease [Anaerotignum sp.]
MREKSKAAKGHPAADRKRLGREVWRHRELYLMMIPAVIALIIFRYIPMYGTLMAFQDVKLGNSILENDWVGFKHFIRFFNGAWFGTTIRNTIVICLLNNVLCWPFPLFLALLLHNCSNQKIKKLTQSATYIPYLLSLVLVVSIINLFCAGETGLINILLKNLGHERINFFGDPDWVYPLYVISSIWQQTGYGAIVYIAALSSVDAALEEAAMIDGAGKLRRIWHIQLPTILPSVVTMLIMNMGQAFSIGADKMLLLQTDLNLAKSEIISTYVYKTGFLNTQYGFSTAVGIFQSVVNLIVLLIVNKISQKLTDISVF